MESLYWKVDRDQALDAPTRAWLLANFGHAAAPEHTWGAIIGVFAEDASGTRCVTQFAFTFVASGALTGDTEDVIATAARARIRALRNAEPLATIRDRKHWL